MGGLRVLTLFDRTCVMTRGRGHSDSGLGLRLHISRFVHVAKPGGHLDEPVQEQA